VRTRVRASGPRTRAGSACEQTRRAARFDRFRFFSIVGVFGVGELVFVAGVEGVALRGSDPVF